MNKYVPADNMDISALYQQFLLHPYISTDTRNIRRNSIFFSLKGSNFNGNTFARVAVENGAALAVIDETAYKLDERFVLVEDALTCLQQLAQYHRNQLNIPIIGITGSNGKTTTKELINAVLSRKFNTYATKGNLNNHIGVPLSLLEIDHNTEIGIIEMGANHLGEIKLLCKIADPNYGLITNIGKAHLEGFGGLKGVIQAKGELYDWIKKHSGTLFLQADNPVLSEMIIKREIRTVLSYGESEENMVSGSAIQSDPFLSVTWQYKGKPHLVDTQITGRYNIENILAAICVGIHFKIHPDQINKGINTYQPSNNRSQVIKTTYNTVICDFYNANASSMQAAIENLRDQDAKQKVLILGDMFELGATSDQEHLEIIRMALRINPDRCIFIGDQFFKHNKVKKAGMEFYESVQEAELTLKAHPLRGAFILLKASRGMAFEKLLNSL